ncbi:MAG TPA: KTSC domain-containing protein [Allosphingosinicella sp.]|nr:KTSC domain-containing protein [Allosphingosinicella sp.]
MRAARIDSSAISRVAYDDDSRTLSIWFRDTGRYFYHEVPRAAYEALARAPSAGRHFNAFIKERYRCTPERRRFRPAQAASGRSSR